MSTFTREDKLGYFISSFYTISSNPQYSTEEASVSILDPPRLQPFKVLQEHVIDPVQPLSPIIRRPLLREHVLVRPDVLSNRPSSLLQMSDK